ncbi:MAG: MBL fold metallo-hydrolase [Planctomycetes bacterium]|nr:MBL fold metallo-hydrolase [Planctomycetota bacterium]
MIMNKNGTMPNDITVTFWGAAHTVTGSMHLVQAGRQRVLLDCGLFQGRRAEAWARNKDFPFPPHTIDAVVLSHAHIDHCGNLPNLVRRGFNGPIYCTPATRDLIAVMLADSAKIQDEDAAHLNRHRRPGDPKVEPLYNYRDVRRTLQLARSVPYETDHAVGKNVSARFVDAGHLLGSAMVHLDLAGGRSITFTGDLGRRDMPILRDPRPIPPADLIISESTYGGRNHPGVEMLATDLGAVVNRTIARGGKVLIPAFSLGRTQTIVFFLHQLVNSGMLKPLPIYVDSPLSAAATEVFRLHPECFDEETSLLLFEDHHLFGEKLVKFTRSVEESKSINQTKEPCIIIAASGMCESGRILHHLKSNVEDPRNTVLIIGFQAPETLGRRLVEKKPEVRILNTICKLRAEVVVLNGFSGHAGRDELLEMLTPLVDAKRKVRLVHGDPDQAAALMATLKERGFADVIYPDRGETVAVE